jgi:hypothetical protein
MPCLYQYSVNQLDKEFVFYFFAGKKFTYVETKLNLHH